jgi:hypothetical protein
MSPASCERNDRGEMAEIGVLQLPHSRASAGSSADSVPGVSPQRNVRRFIIDVMRTGSRCE